MPCTADFFRRKMGLFATYIRSILRQGKEEHSTMENSVKVAPGGLTPLKIRKSGKDEQN